MHQEISLTILDHFRSENVVPNPDKLAIPPLEVGAEELHLSDRVFLRVDDHAVPDVVRVLHKEEDA
jgi:hypothetical protein